MVLMVYMSYCFVFKKFLKLANEQTLILVVFCFSDIIYLTPRVTSKKVVRIEPNLVGSIPCKIRVYNRENFGHSLSLERVTFSYVNSRLIRIINFKNRTFSKVKKWSKLNQTWYAVSPVCLDGKAKRIYGIACVSKKFVFHR